MEASEAEKQLDAFTARANDTAPVTEEVAVQASDEDIVEEKARESHLPIVASVLQKRTTLNETQLEKRIASTLRRYPDILESELREEVANTLDENDGIISEAQYSRTVDGLIPKKEDATPGGLPQGFDQGPLISPPPIVSNNIASLQDGATRLADRASALSTPGGIGFLVFVLMFFIWAIIPINSGKTRLQLLWGVLTNQVYLKDEGEGPSGGGGAGGSFGDAGGGSNAVGGGNVSRVPSLPYVPSFDLDEW